MILNATCWEKFYVRRIKCTFPECFLDWDYQDTAEDLPNPFSCNWCGKAFNKLSDLKSHCALRHGYRNCARRFAVGTTCRCCLKQFHTRPKLIKHLTSGRPQCLQNLVASRHPLLLDEVAQLDSEDLKNTKAAKRAGIAQLEAYLPEFRAIGPLQCSFTQDNKFALNSNVGEGVPDGVFPLGVRIFDRYLHPGPHKGNSELEFNYYIAQPRMLSMSTMVIMEHLHLRPHPDLAK